MRIYIYVCYKNSLPQLLYLNNDTYVAIMQNPVLESLNCNASLVLES